MRIFVITSSRADYGLLKPLITTLKSDAFFDVQIIATGTHLSAKYGNTSREIEEDGFEIYSSINILEDNDDARAMTKTSSNALTAFGELYETDKPDAVLVLGDRYEIFSSVFAALFFKIPVIHYSGGEKTEGAYDDALRHCISKMSHLHFVSCDEYRNRVIQLGEKPSHVFNVGSLGVENILNTKLLNKHEFEKSLGVNLTMPFFLVSYHPETLSNVSAERQFEELLIALDSFKDFNIIFTKSNADAGGMSISFLIDQFVTQHSNAIAFESLGLLRYLSAINLCEVVIGNSSSGVTEVPTFRKPTVNIGERQKGRIQAKSIVNAPIDSEEIKKAIHKALSSEFRNGFDNAMPFGNGTASAQITEIIKSFDFTNITRKSFFDITLN